MGFACWTNSNGFVYMIVIKDAVFAVESIGFRAMDAVNAVVFFKAGSAVAFNETEHW